MRQVCYVCKKQYGVKLPLDNDSVTHGICKKCFPGELKRLEHEKKEYVAKVKQKTNR